MGTKRLWLMDFLSKTKTTMVSAVPLPYVVVLLCFTFSWMPGLVSLQALQLSDSVRSRAESFLRTRVPPVATHLLGGRKSTEVRGFDELFGYRDGMMVFSSLDAACILVRSLAPHGLCVSSVFPARRADVL